MERARRCGKKIVSSAKNSRKHPCCQVKKKQLGLLRHKRKHEISPLLPQVGRGSVAPRMNWHRVKNKGVAKSWDKNYRKKKQIYKRTTGVVCL